MKNKRFVQEKRKFKDFNEILRGLNIKQNIGFQQIKPLPIEQQFADIDVIHVKILNQEQ